jgi:DDE superfamily endonuclease
MTVDGVHCSINEPKHPEFSQDKDYFSHKKAHAGYCYELGISIFTPNLIWMSGPHKAGQNDKTIFVKAGGLKEALRDAHVKAIGDKFYNGHPNEVSCFNAYDSEDVREFKRRALLRHEKFNGLLKQFAVLDTRYRHLSPEKFASCFEAVVVICQYRIELECPLFDI